MTENLRPEDPDTILEDLVVGDSDIVLEDENKKNLPMQDRDIVSGDSLVVKDLGIGDLAAEQPGIVLEDQVVENLDITPKDSIKKDVVVVEDSGKAMENLVAEDLAVMEDLGTALKDLVVVEDLSIGDDLNRLVVEE